MSMSTPIKTIGLGALILGTGVGLTTLVGGVPTTATATSSAAPARTTQTMVLAFPWTGGHQKFVDTGKKGVGPGDLFLGVGAPILDNATGDRVGEGDSVELVVSGRHDGTVTSRSTLRLPGGHVEIDGVARHTDAPLRMTVTGGTGRYLGVGGQLTTLREDRKRKVTVMRLELVR